MGKLVLYGHEISPPVRAVILTLNALGLDYELRIVNFAQGETRTEDYKEKNPQHTVPMLEDNGQFIWDSHAIAAYLVRKYGDTDDLYPKDFYQRAVVDQRLHFDSGVLFSSLRNITAPLLISNVTNVLKEKIDAFYSAYDFLEAFLQHDYLAGDKLTIADFSVVSTVSTLADLAPIDPLQTPKLAAWINRLSQLPYYEKANEEGAAKAVQMLKSKLKKI